MRVPRVPGTSHHARCPTHPASSEGRAWRGKCSAYTPCCPRDCREPIIFSYGNVGNIQTSTSMMGTGGRFMPATESRKRLRLTFIGTSGFRDYLRELLLLARLVYREATILYPRTRTCSNVLQRAGTVCVRLVNQAVLGGFCILSTVVSLKFLGAALYLHL